MNTWVIGQGQSGDIKKHLLARAGADVTSFYCFDYFDTLVVRSVEPEYTKKMASTLLSQLCCWALAADELYAMRQDLEKQLCEKQAAAGGELEFYLPDFAREFRYLLSEKIGSQPLVDDESRFVQILLNIETAVELQVQKPCYETIEVLQYLKREKKQTILVSDFYLPKSHFRQMLQNFGLMELLDHIYISADYGLAKGSGRLYEKVIKDLGCNPDQLLMIGDNQHSDVHMAEQKGLATIHIQNPKQAKFYAEWKPETKEESKTNANFSQLAHTTGPFREMEFSLWLFTVRLFRQLTEKKVKNVFFFSKEGEFLKKLFDRFQIDVFGQKIINSHYLLVSRKATFLASLKPLAEEDFGRLFTYYRDISLRDFLLSLNIEESLAQSICKSCDLDFQTRYPDLKNSDEFNRLIRLDKFKQLYENRRLTQRRNFMLYLDSFGVDYVQDGLTIVDVGWKGSIQDNVFHILEGEIKIQGYFVGSLFATEKSKNNQKKGLLFDDSPQVTRYFNVYNNNRSLFEMVLGASHGSADGYFTKEQFAQLPDDHQRNVQQSVKISSEEIVVATLDLKEERELFKKSIEPLQKQILAVVPTLNRLYVQEDGSYPDSEWFARRHARMVFKPDRTEIDFFESLYHLENFGIFEYTDFRTDTRLSLKQRLRNLKNIMRDQSILEIGTWPPIILRRLGIGPYRFLDGHRRYKSAFK